MRKLRKFIIVLGVGLAFLFPKFSHDAIAEESIDFAAFGVGFQCVGPVAIGQLFDNGEDRCDPHGTANLFTNAICTYENILDQVLSKLYCGLQFSLLQPLGALMVLFAIMVGAGFALGIIPLSPREIMMALFKFGLVYYFATEAELTIGIVYSGIMGFIQESVLVIMQHVAPDVGTLSGGGGLFEKMDLILANFAENAATSQAPGSPCEEGLLAMFMTFVASVPMLAMFGVSMAMQFVMVFFQMVLGYFVAITGIMFLTAMAPIFLSFALFKFTRSYFDKWAKYLLGFAIQIFVVVGFIGVVASLELDEDLRELFDLAMPYTVVRQAEGVRLPYRDLCSICEPDTFGQFGITCKSNTPLDPQQLLSNPDFVRVFSNRLFKILVLAYILHKAMIAVPGVARALGASDYAPAVAGQDVFSMDRSIRFPGTQAATRTTNSISQAPTSSQGVARLLGQLVTNRK